MLFAAALPSLLAWLFRAYHATVQTVPCSYLYHANSSMSTTEVLHGRLADQLIFVDQHPTDESIVINKTAEFCKSGAGNFCYEVRACL